MNLDTSKGQQTRSPLWVISDITAATELVRFCAMSGRMVTTS
jgi:hypothetical protein